MDTAPIEIGFQEHSQWHRSGNILDFLIDCREHIKRLPLLYGIIGFGVRQQLNPEQWGERQYQLIEMPNAWQFFSTLAMALCENAVKRLNARFPVADNLGFASFLCQDINPLDRKRAFLRLEMSYEEYQREIQPVDEHLRSPEFLSKVFTQNAFRDEPVAADISTIKNTLAPLVSPLEVIKPQIHFFEYNRGCGESDDDTRAQIYAEKKARFEEHLGCTIEEYGELVAVQFRGVLANVLNFADFHGGTAEDRHFDLDQLPFFPPKTA